MSGIAPRRLILSEVDALIIGLRTNSRFSNRARFQYEIPKTNENALMIELKELRDKLSTNSTFQTLNLIDILTPFFSIIQSEDTTGPITGVALQSVQKMLEHPCITQNMDGAKLALEEIVNAVQHCQFEVTDAQTDEAVLLKILQLFTACVRSEGGILLDEKHLVEVMKSCFRIGRETRPTEILRRSAEDSLLEITQVVFKRVRDGVVNVSMEGVFEFICDLCDPEKQGKSASCRLLGLSLASCVLEIMGTKLVTFERLLAIAQNNLSRALLRNSVTSNIVVLSQTLRGMTNLIACAAPYLHEQIEQFILTTHLRIADSKQVTFEHQELVLESLIELCRDTSLIVFLYEHYDCSEYSSNLFESICKFFSKNLKESETLHTIHVLSLQGLLSIVKCLAERCQDESANAVPNQESNAKLEEIRTRKETKKKMMEVAESFNGSYKHGMQKMRSAGLMGTSRNADEEGKLVANFLHEYSNWLSKAEIGKTIRNNGEFHERTLYHYMHGIDMHGLTVDEALRYMIQKFELTGEAQQVERQILQFADVYFGSNPDHPHLKSSESVFMCAVAIIMLNTDLHNPQMKERNKMSLSQFINNSSYIGLPNEELERLYNNILKSQFQPSTSFNDTHKSDPMWEDMLQRSNKYLQQYPSVVSGTSQLRLDVDMFQSMWGNTIMATSIVLENTEDVDVLEMSVRGFLDSARIAAHYRLSNVFDNLVITLCKFTQMLSSHQDNAITLFGQNEKAQLACRTVFAITRNYGDNLREGWKNILDLILRMYQLDLLPEELSERETFNQTKIKREGKKTSSQSSQAGSGLYLFGFFGASDDNIQQKQSMDRAKKCIEQCRITDLLLEAKILHISSLEYLINALITACLESNTDQHSDTSMFCLDLLTDITISNKDAAHDRITIIWNYVYNHMNKLLMNVLSKYDTNNTNKRLSKEHYAVIDRVLLCVLRQCIELMSGRDDMLTTMSKALHHVLTVIPPHLSHYFLLQLYPGIELLIKQAGSKLSARTWDLIFRLLRAGGSSAKTAEKAAQVCAVITREHGFYMPDNVPECVHTILALMGNRVESIELVSMLHQQVNHLIVTTQLQQSQPVSADSPWMRAWLTTLSGLTWLCTSSERDVRNQSIGVLQRILINSSDKTTETSSLPSSFLVLCLKQVLFVLLDDALALQAPRKRTSGHKLQEDYDREQQQQQQQQQQSVTGTNHFFGSLRHVQQQFDYSSLDELRLRVSALFTKIFLHFLPRVQETDELPALWETIMNYMYRFMNIGSDSLSESVPELLKNMILVMNNLEVFKNDQALWNRTEQQLNLFVPRLVEDVKTKVILPQQPQEEKVDVPQSL